MNHFAKIILAVLIPWTSCHMENDPTVAESRLIPQPEPTVENTVSERLYDEILTGRAAEANGTPFSFSVYKSNDGRSVSTKYTPGTPDSVERAFLSKLKSATKILVQTRKNNFDNRNFEQRAVLLISGAKMKDQTVNIVLANDSRLLVFESDSVETALDFEKWFFSTHIP